MVFENVDIADREPTPQEMEHVSYCIQEMQRLIKLYLETRVGEENEQKLEQKQLEQQNIFSNFQIFQKLGNEIQNNSAAQNHSTHNIFSSTVPYSPTYELFLDESENQYSDSQIQPLLDRLVKLIFFKNKLTDTAYDIGVIKSLLALLSIKESSVCTKRKSTMLLGLICLSRCRRNRAFDEDLKLSLVDKFGKEEDPEIKEMVQETLYNIQLLKLVDQLKPSVVEQLHTLEQHMHALGEPFCANCHCKQNLFICPKCKKTYYCSTDCVVADWPLHKIICKDGRHTQPPAELQAAGNLSEALATIKHKPTNISSRSYQSTIGNSTGTDTMNVDDVMSHDDEHNHDGTETCYSTPSSASTTSSSSATTSAPVSPLLHQYAATFNSSSHVKVELPRNSREFTMEDYEHCFAENTQNEYSVGVWVHNHKTIMGHLNWIEEESAAFSYYYFPAKVLVVNQSNNRMHIDTTKSHQIIFPAFATALQGNLELKSPISVYPGHPCAIQKGGLYLAPIVAEYQGQDMREHILRQIVLNPREYCVLEMGFPVYGRAKDQSIIPGMSERIVLEKLEKMVFYFSFLDNNTSATSGYQQQQQTATMHSLDVFYCKMKIQSFFKSSYLIDDKGKQNMDYLQTQQAIHNPYIKSGNKAKFACNPS